MFNKLFILRNKSKLNLTIVTLLSESKVNHVQFMSLNTKGSRMHSDIYAEDLLHLLIHFYFYFFTGE